MRLNGRLLFLVTIILLLNGCASYPQNEVAKIDAMPDVSSYKTKPSAYIDFKFMSGKPDASQSEMPTVKDQLMPAIEEIVQESALFSNTTFDEFEKSKMDYTIKLHVYNHSDEGAAAVSGFITGFTLGVIPGVATDNYTLKVSVEDQSGNVVAGTENKDSISTWLGIWFIPVMSNTPDIAVKETIGNQIRSALKQLVEDKKLKYSLKSIDDRYEQVVMTKQARFAW